LQARVIDLARRDPDARARLATAFGDLDVQTCAFALASPQREEAVRTLGPALISAARAVGLDAVLPWPADADREHVADPSSELHRVTSTHPALRLATRDRNPLRFVEAHPDKHGNALALGERPLAAWIDALADALALIATGLPALAAELEVTLRRIVPIGYDAVRHLSCSYREAPGLVYLTLHPNVLTMAEAIIHESQHAKLNLLSWSDPILDHAADELVASPVRPDPRPVFGVLLAVHAFVPVAWLYRRLAALDHPLSRGPWFERRLDQILDGNADGVSVLRTHARPTAMGSRVLDAVYALDAGAREGHRAEARHTSTSTQIGQ
jgi:HEXXH motif-containing protein